MTKEKKFHDIISEQEFTSRGKNASTNPQDDSPLDSEKDSVDEYSLGMNYKPIATELADEDEDFQNKNSSVVHPNNIVFSPQKFKIRTPTSVIIKSSPGGKK